MDISGAVLRRSAISSGLGLRRDLAGLVIGRKARVSVRPTGVAISGGRGFSDEGHLAYYASPVRCGDGGGKMKAVKKRAKLVKGLADDLAALCSAGIEAGEESSGKTITEAAQILMAELEKLRGKEEERKRRKKEEKAAMKAAKMKAVCAEEESSDSSSESNDSDCKCETLIDVKNLNSNSITEEKPGIEILQPQSMSVQEPCSAKKKKVCAKGESSSSSSESSESSDSDCEGETVVSMSSLKTTMNPEAKPANPAPSMYIKDLKPQTTPLVDKNQDSPKIAEESINVSSCFSSTMTVNSTDCSVNVSRTLGLAEKSTDKIEVCMGGKCKRSGAIELLQEFEKKIGIEGAVVSCKCMGKCKEGPNVRVVTQCSNGDSIDGLKNPLCIGVGLEDVPMIVANFFGDDKNMGLLTA